MIMAIRIMAINKMIIANNSPDENKQISEKPGTNDYNCI